MQDCIKLLEDMYSARKQIIEAGNGKKINSNIIIKDKIVELTINNKQIK